MSDITIYPENVEQCARIGGMLELQEGDLGLHGQTLYASSKIGRKRENQEDATLVMQHPKNPEFKIMVVADGMGGMDKGEVASNIVIQVIKEWFESLNLDYYDKEEDELGTKFTSIMNKINIAVTERLKDNGGTTFVGAIIGKTKTIIINIGDSRAYSYNRGRVKKLTTDDSFSQKLYEQGLIPEEDDMRFHIENNIITNYIGSKRPLIAKPIYLNNVGYEKLILTSDGVTDCLSEQQIEQIIQGSENNKVAMNIAEAANNTNSQLRTGLKKNCSEDGYYYGECLEKWTDYRNGEKRPILYVPEIKGGKDNITVAVFVNKKAIELRQEERKDER